MKVDGDGDDDFESTSGMVDTCHGDSGGPLACQVPHQHQGQLYFFIAICIAIMTIMFITNIHIFLSIYFTDRGRIVQACRDCQLGRWILWRGLYIFLSFFTDFFDPFLNFPLCSPENLGFTRECNITTSGSER